LKNEKKGRKAVITILPSAATIGGAATAGAFAVSAGPLQR